MPSKFRQVTELFIFADMGRSHAHCLGTDRGSSDTPSGGRGGRGRDDSPPPSPPAPENVEEAEASTDSEVQQIRPCLPRRLTDGHTVITLNENKYKMNFILQFIIKYLCVEFNFFFVIQFAG